MTVRILIIYIIFVLIVEKTFWYLKKLCIMKLAESFCRILWGVKLKFNAKTTYDKKKKILGFFENLFDMKSRNCSKAFTTSFCNQKV